MRRDHVMSEAQCRRRWRCLGVAMACIIMPAVSIAPTPPKSGSRQYSCLEGARTHSLKESTPAQLGFRSDSSLGATVSEQKIFAEDDAGGDDVVEDVDVPELTAEEKDFLERANKLCQERNFPFRNIKNARDLSSVPRCPVIPGRAIRLGRVSDATDEDIEILFNELEVKTLIDLRSPTELKDDPTLERPEVFGNFTTLVWSERGRGEGCVRELEPGESRIRKKSRGRALLDGIRNGMGAATGGNKKEENDLPLITETFTDLSSGEVLESDDEDCPEDCIPPGRFQKDHSRADRKERHFVSLMNEFKYVKGTLSKLRKRDIVKAALRSPGAPVSRRVRRRVKDTFLDEINDGGLPMLNELLLRFGAPGIRYVLEVVADRSRHPVAFYCTAGKDRTGMIAALILAATGVPDESIVEDYSLSANVYSEMNDHKAMVGALSQRNLDPKTFLGAPPKVMRDTLAAVRENYGSVEGYLDWIGFDEQDRERLNAALTL